jgi:hypothetical protein
MAWGREPSHRECVLHTRCGCTRTITLKTPVDEYIRIPLETNTIHIMTTDDPGLEHMTIPVRIFRRTVRWSNGEISSRIQGRMPTRSELQYHYRECEPNEPV